MNTLIERKFFHYKIQFLCFHFSCKYSHSCFSASDISCTLNLEVNFLFATVILSFALLFPKTISSGIETLEANVIYTFLVSYGCNNKLLKIFSLFNLICSGICVCTFKNLTSALLVTTISSKGSASYISFPNFKQISLMPHAVSDLFVIFTLHTYHNKSNYRLLYNKRTRLDTV